MSENPDSRKSTTHHLTKGGLATYSTKVISVGLGFVAQLLIARYLGTAGYGDFSFALVTLNFLVVGAVAGADSVATRFVSVFHESPAMMRHCLTWLNRRAFVLSAIYLGVALLLLEVMKQLDARQIWTVTQIICIALPFQVFSVLRQGMLQGFQRPALSQVSELLVRPMLTIALVVLSVFLWPETWNPFSAQHVAAILVVVTLIVMLVGQFLLSRVMPQDSEQSEEKVERSQLDQSLAEWRSMAWASTFAAVALTIHSQCDVWMLGILVENDQVGPYAVAVRYAAFVVFGLNAVNTALAPLVAKSANDTQKLQHLASRAVWLSFWLALGVAILLVSCPEYLLGWFGEGFEVAGTPLRILVIANVFNVVCGSVGMLLNMSGYHKEFMKVLLASVLVNILLNATLIPLFQTTGAAWATALSVATWNVLCWMLVRKHLGVRPTLGGLF